MKRVVFVDVETSGLDPARHSLWEVAIIDPGLSPMVFRRELSGTALAESEPAALIVNRYYERISEKVPPGVTLIQERDYVMAEQIAQVLSGVVLAGIGPWFDAQFLNRFLRRNGQGPAWDHRLVNCKDLAVGWFMGEDFIPETEDAEVVAAARRLAEEGPPFETRDLAMVLGIDRGDAHTALADVKLAKAFYDYAMEAKAAAERME